MKKIKTTLLLVLCAIALTGCREQPQAQRDAAVASHITEFNYKGHRYLKYSYAEGGQCGTVGITHDPDCPCREKGDSI